MSVPPYRTLSAHLRERFGARVQKIPLDAGFTCPNRDGTISRQGCLFCNPRGSGSGLLETGISLAGQWDHWRDRLGRRYKARLFIAYLQSFSNTHGPARKLARVLDELEGLPGLAVLSVGTRPDCLDPEKLDLLAGFPAREVWLEMGLQSASDRVLARINRGHDAACFARAVRDAAGRGLSVVAHVMAGLPGEEPGGLVRTVEFLNKLPVAGIKFHNTYVARDTPLEEMWNQGEFRPLDISEYARVLGRALDALDPGVVVHRLTGDPAPGELLAPHWAARKSEALETLRKRLETEGVRQGRDCLNTKT